MGKIYKKSEMIGWSVFSLLFIAGNANAREPYLLEAPSPVNLTPGSKALGTSGSNEDMIADINDNGACVTGLTDANNDERLNAYDDYCARLLLPPRPIVSIPGLIFIGGAIGSNAKKFIIAPGVGINAGAAIPLLRPRLGYRLEDGKIVYLLPRVSSFFIDFLISANVAMEGVLFPGNKDKNGDPETEFAWSIGAYVGIELGGVQFTKQGTEKVRIAGTLGAIVGYLGQSDVVGNAFIAGFQPGFSVVF
jgi:hypothetical protein